MPGGNECLISTSIIILRYVKSYLKHQKTLIFSQNYKIVIYLKGKKHLKVMRIRSITAVLVVIVIVLFFTTSNSSAQLTEEPPLPGS
jgi:hypothetical protein